MEYVVTVLCPMNPGINQSSYPTFLILWGLWCLVWKRNCCILPFKISPNLRLSTMYKYLNALVNKSTPLLKICFTFKADQFKVLIIFLFPITLPLSHLNHFLWGEGAVIFIWQTLYHLLNSHLGTNYIHLGHPSCPQPFGTCHMSQRLQDRSNSATVPVHEKWGTDCETSESHSWLQYPSSQYWRAESQWTKNCGTIMWSSMGW